MNHLQSRLNKSGHHFLLAALITLFTASGLYGEEAKAGTSLYQVTASVLNVRSGPSTKHRLLRKIVGGTRVTIDKSHGNWRAVSLRNGKRIGWVSSRYLAYLEGSNRSSLSRAHGTSRAASARNALGNAARKQ